MKLDVLNWGLQDREVLQDFLGASHVTCLPYIQ